MKLNQEENTNKILIELKYIQKFKSKENREVLFKDFIKERLDKAVKSYYHELSKAIDGLSNYDDRHDLSIIKRLSGVK